MKLLDTRFPLYDYMRSILIFQKNSKYFEYKFKKTNSTVRLEFRLNCSAVSNRKYAEIAICDRYCLFASAALVVTQKLPVSTLLKVESRPEFAQDHKSRLRSYRGPVVLCDFSKLRFQKSPYEFLNLYGRFCPYNPPYNPRHDTLSPNLHIEIFTQRKKTRRKSIECITLYRLTSRKSGLEISFRMQIWGQWVNKNDLPFISERTVHYSLADIRVPAEPGAKLPVLNL